MRFICPECDDKGVRNQFMNFENYNRGAWMIVWCKRCNMIYSVEKTKATEMTDCWHACLDDWAKDILYNCLDNRVRERFVAFLNSRGAMTLEKLEQSGINRHFLRFWFVRKSCMGRFRHPTKHEEVLYTNRQLYNSLDEDLIRKLD